MIWPFCECLRRDGPLLIFIFTFQTLVDSGSLRDGMWRSPSYVSAMIIFFELSDSLFWMNLIINTEKRIFLFEMPKLNFNSKFETN